MGYEDDFKTDAYKCSDDKLIEVLENRGYNFTKNIIFDKKLSIIESSAFNTLLTNIDNIPLEEIERLNKKYNLFNHGNQNLIGYE